LCVSYSVGLQGISNVTIYIRKQIYANAVRTGISYLSVNRLEEHTAQNNRPSILN